MCWPENKTLLHAVLRLRGRLSVCCAVECAGGGRGAMVTPVHFAITCEGLLHAKCQLQPERQAQLIKAFVREELA